MDNKTPAINYFDAVKGESLTSEDLSDYTKEIRRVCDQFPGQVKDLKAKLSKKYDKVYAVGIGDSLYSADTVKFDFWNNTGIQMEVLESQEFNNYYIDYMPKNSLVFICSGGGSAARTVESSYLAQKRGAAVVAITLTPKSRLTASCDDVLCFSTEKRCFIDGSRNYMSLALLLKLVGIQIGLFNGTLQKEKENAILDKVVSDMTIGFKSLMKNEKTIRTIMDGAKDQRKFYFLGAGPSYYLAHCGAAKFMEESAADGIVQQLEEYGHEQYWVNNRRLENATIISICPDGKSVQRCVENLDEQNFLGMNTILLTTSPVNDLFVEKADYTIATDGPLAENDYWMAAGGIVARMANFYTQFINFSDKRFLSSEQFIEHYRTIHYSRLLPEVAEFDIEIPDDKTIGERGAYGLTFGEEDKSE